MKLQNQWLFESPLAPKFLDANPFADSEHNGEMEMEMEWEVQSDRHDNFTTRYGTPEFLFDPELEEEYRRHNQKFRREMANKIGSVTNHPLQFLVKQGQGRKWVFRTAKDRRVDAGHVTPVMTLRKRGSTTERLAVQDRRLNRSDGAKMGVAGKGKRIKVLDIAGVPVDLDSVRKYIQMGLLANTWLKAKSHRGWKAPGNKELEFALGEFHDWISLPDPAAEMEGEWEAPLFMHLPDIPTEAIPSDVKQSISTTLKAVAQLVLPALQARSLTMLMNTALFLISPETWSQLNAAQRRAVAQRSLILAAKQYGISPKSTPSPSRQRGLSSTQVKQIHRRQAQRGRKPGFAPLNRWR
jgi:hypothetical protein